MRASVHTGMAESCRVSLPEAVAYPLELGDGRRILRRPGCLGIVTA
jgi:hypothetical protein